MPLHILLILVIGGIAAVALALHLLGMSGAPPFTEKSAREGWLRNRPDDTVIAIELSGDGHAARVSTDMGRGILWHMGADTCARLLNGREYVRTRPGTLTLHLNDFTAPKVRLRLRPDEQDDWANWITHT